MRTKRYGFAPYQGAVGITWTMQIRRGSCGDPHQNWCVPFRYYALFRGLCPRGSIWLGL